MKFGALTAYVDKLRATERFIASDALAGVALDTELDDPRIDDQAALALLAIARAGRWIRDTDIGYWDYLEHHRVWPARLADEATMLEMIRDGLPCESGQPASQDDYRAAVDAVIVQASERDVMRGARPDIVRSQVAQLRIEHAREGWPLLVREAYDREVFTGRVLGYMVRAVANPANGGRRAA